MGLLDKFKKKSNTKKPEKNVEKKSTKTGKVDSAKKKNPKTRSFDPTLVPSAEKETTSKKDSSKKEAVKPSPKKAKKEDTKNAYRVLIRPVITEKATSLVANGQYVFEVAPDANKVEIRKAIQNLYSVTPVKVRIMNQKARRVQYGRNTGTTKFWKKAIVNLKSGDKIEIHEGV
ncbi:50S ribosomal protein L23 [Patescibacteria group bacterium]|nr:50S ribosomal protein L23 [Patescibacteria group bacterium]MBU1074886.1 50S ribosomal protein L23 [Patescibacteria group bacterium]MBU1951398.1 50S ribosomal protein L23 [Patescibacteria group bacterium]MBU2235630.1 50S ribosomal protein L23 [Patescibacteria group bacterium]